MKSSFRFLFGFLCLWIPVCGFSAILAPKPHLPIDVEADSLSYSQDQRFLEASGNVRAAYENYRVSANYLQVDLKQKKAVFKGGFSLVRNERAISGQELHYDLERREGQASDVFLTLGKTWVKGESLDIQNDKVFLKNTTLSGCNRTPPDYQFTAADTTFFLKWGMMVSNGSMLWLYGVPVMVVPTYIVGDPLSGVEIPENTPLPRVGADEVNGTTVQENLTYYVDEQNSGTADLEWYEKHGWRLGFRHNYRNSLASFGNLRLHYHTKFGFEGGVTHKFLIAQEASAPRTNVIEQFFDFVPLRYTPFMEAQFDLSAGEVVPGDRDWQRVSLLPELTLTVPRQKALVSGLDRKFVLKLGNLVEKDLVTQENRTNRIRALTQLQYFWETQFPWEIRVQVNPAYEGRWYWSRWQTTNSWNLLTTELNFFRDFTWFRAELGYLHNFWNNGNSAFSFDGKETALEDELRYKLDSRLGENRLGISWRYNLIQQAYRDIDITVGINMHCWNLMLTRRMVRNEFQIGISLN